MDTFEFLRINARYMTESQPDIWSYDKALEELTNWFTALVATDELTVAGDCGGYQLEKTTDEGFTEYRLLKVVSSIGIDTDTGECYAGHWLDGSIHAPIGLPSISE